MSRRPRSAGLASAEQLLLTVAVALAAAAPFTGLGDAFATRVSGDADGHAAGPHAPWAAAQAGVLSAAAETAEAAARADDLVRAAKDAPHRLHVFVSNDWDVPDHAAETFALQERLHREHPALKITQFIGPYTFTDPAVPTRVKRSNVDWALRMEAEHGDELGLHIHPYTHFVAAAGVRPKLGPVFADARAGRDPGYVVNLGAAFGLRETRRLLRGAKHNFGEAGLPEPRSFRAGGWTAADHTLRALADEGFRVDASAVPVSMLEAWRTNGMPLYAWLSEQWPHITTESQPYFPARGSGRGRRGTLPLLEVPDNGALADYATGEQMIDIFRRTVAAGLEDGPRVLSIGYHGVSLPSYFSRIDAALRHLDGFLAENGAGPVVYSTAQEIADLFGAPK